MAGPPPPIYREPIYPTAHTDERSQTRLLVPLTSLVVDYSLVPHEDFRGKLFSEMDEQRDMIGRFRCDARLIREAVEIDFRVGGRLVETSKDSRLFFSLLATFCDHRKRFLSSRTKISPRRKTVSHGKCSHLRREISRYPRVVFYGIRESPKSVARARARVCVARVCMSGIKVLRRTDCSPQEIYINPRMFVNLSE